MRHRLLVVLLLMTGILVIAPGTACACSCALLEPAEQVKGAAAVFTGTVVAARRVEGDPLGPPPPVVYTFRADQIYKGKASAEFEVATNADSAACGYNFVTGSRYLVFAAAGQSGLLTADPGVALNTSLCAGNLLVSPGDAALRAGDDLPSGESLAAELVTALGTATPPPATPPSTAVATPAPDASGSGGQPIPIWIYAGVAVTGAGLTFTGWRFSRRRGRNRRLPD
ncbi:hypothetical protein ABZ260_25320 [Streptosporangium sp. NPDC006013]|uniref:hypothetical protein n=1 Tax=Streptosporangium sp. NPDC006013 TaxID=3155596 RepID=UPI0033A0F335